MTMTQRRSGFAGLAGRAGPVGPGLHDGRFAALAPTTDRID